MNPAEILALMEEVDLLWPGQGPARAEDDERVARLWLDWFGAYDYQTARRALRAFGGQQARAPSPAQLLGECRILAGETPPAYEDVLAEFKRQLRTHSTTGPLRAEWWSSPVVAVFALSGAYRDWGASSDGASDPDLAASEAAFRASQRRLWDSYSARVERVGLPAAARYYGLDPGTLGLDDKRPPEIEQGGE